ncbi:MAG TPA: cell division protein FtsZ, partial [Acidobacteriota bacterium]|nr:cell division protein FtsZ [Acidobacteriota bacterium]
ALTVAVVTRPFDFEGRRRSERADEGIAELKEKVDTLICIPNQRLLTVVEKTTRLTDAFYICDETLHQATKGIADLVTIPGLINCDFADVRTVMREMGDAIMGTGTSDVDGNAAAAARAAIQSPLLEDVSISGARGVLVNITGGPDLTLYDVNEASSVITEAAGEDANIIFGAVIDPNMKNDIRVTVIATGFGPPRRRPHEQERQIRISTTNRLRGAAASLDMFVTDAPSSANRIAGLTMGDDSVLTQPRLSAEEADNIEVPAFVRKHLGRTEHVPAGEDLR